MKKCPYCTAENPDNANVCEFCGKSLLPPPLAEITLPTPIPQKQISIYKIWTKILLWSFLGSFTLFVVGLATNKIGVGILAICLFFGAIIGLIINGRNARNSDKATFFL
jgi:hypothetical protein